MHHHLAGQVIEVVVFLISHPNRSINQPPPNTHTHTHTKHPGPRLLRGHARPVPQRGLWHAPVDGTGHGTGWLVYDDDGRLARLI
jgi:hypothetical protein